jgi:hypothetical protein
VRPVAHLNATGNTGSAQGRRLALAQIMEVRFSSFNAMENLNDESSGETCSRSQEYFTRMFIAGPCLNRLQKAVGQIMNSKDPLGDVFRRDCREHAAVMVNSRNACGLSFIIGSLRQAEAKAEDGT